MRRLNVWPTSQLLSRLYWLDRKSLKQVARELKASESTVRYWMKVAGVPNRNRLSGLRLRTMHPARERFWSHVRMGEPEQCWPWTGAKNKHGYGEFTVSTRMKMLAHRFSYILAAGEDPRNLFVLHACDNPACVNPTHLRLGTQQENMDDRFRRMYQCEACGRINRIDKRMIPSHNGWSESGDGDSGRRGDVADQSGSPIPPAGHAAASPAVVAKGVR